MTVLYQQVRWNNIFEVCQFQNNIVIFKNGSYWLSASSLEEAKFKISRIDHPSILGTYY